jgi:hypothetical protein
MLFGASGDGVAAARAASLPRACAKPRHGAEGRFLQGRRADQLPWIEESDIDFYGEEFRRTGTAAPLNPYRNIDRNWKLPAHGRPAGDCRRSTSRAIATSWLPSPARTSCSQT